MRTNDFDCIVIGGGHAGIEAAHAAATIGARTCLLTLSKATIAKMSCNPAIGGLGKGQIAREVDALGGLMGLATDATGIQFRLLNRSKGPAVQSPRAQADKYKYQDFMRQRLEETPNLTIVEAMASEILTQDSQVCGVRCTDGRMLSAPTVILTTGTFLRGLMHVGTEQSPGGRLGEPAANELSQSLERIGLELRRLKTGTPVRLDAATVDLDKLEIQHGDPDPMPFSFLTDRIDRPQTPCWITYTNEPSTSSFATTCNRAPLYTGQIKSVGPRYCPSIETKIVRFADKDRHQVFLEPEDEARTTIYCNGISTSLPKDVQEQMLKLMPGTENARIVHYAYAIEYDYCPPVQLQPSLETKTDRRPVPGRPDQRHQRLRGGGRPGHHRRDQRRPQAPGQRAAGARPRPGVHRRPHRRPAHPGNRRAVPHVHLARGVSADPAFRQRRQKTDRDRPVRRACRSEPLRQIPEQA